MVAIVNFFRGIVQITLMIVFLRFLFRTLFGGQLLGMMNPYRMQKKMNKMLYRKAQMNMVRNRADGKFTVPKEFYEYKVYVHERRKSFLLGILTSFVSGIKFIASRFRTRKLEENVINNDIPMNEVNEEENTSSKHDYNYNDNHHDSYDDDSDYEYLNQIFD